MPQTTPLNLITRASRKAGVLGVGQSLLPEDVNDAFSDMQDMLSQWQRERYLVYHLVDVAKVSTGATSYTVGAGMDFDVARPDRLEAAFLRQITQSQPYQIDYPLQILESREDYNQIGLKQLQSFPSYIFYDSDFPVGRVYPWPVPQASIYEVHLTLKAQLTQLTTLNQIINLPLEYNAAILWNLTVWIHAGYPGLPPIPETVALATKSLATLRGANAQIPRLRMPRELLRNGIYDIYSDRVY